MKLSYLCDRLEQIRRCDKRVLRKFVRRLKTNRDDDYAGTVCELNTACILIKKGIHFTNPDPPDFLVRTRATPSIIECTSVHMGSFANKPLSYKVASAIRKKAAKSYCGPATALVIDTTNILFHSHSAGWALTPRSLRNEYEWLVKRSRFGAVVLFGLFGNVENGRKVLRLAYARIDGSRPTYSLHRLLTSVFPLGALETSGMIIPRFS